MIAQSVPWDMICRTLACVATQRWLKCCLNIYVRHKIPNASNVLVVLIILLVSIRSSWPAEISDGYTDVGPEGSWDHPVSWSNYLVDEIHFLESGWQGVHVELASCQC